MELDWKTARNVRGHSQVALAELAGMSLDGYCRIERHEHEPKLFTLMCLAGALNAEVVIRNGECSINLLEG